MSHLISSFCFRVILFFYLRFPVIFIFNYFKAGKRRRVRRSSDGGKQDSNSEPSVKDREIKIGTQKQNAIKHMCNYCTFESYRALQCHLSFFSESSVNESVLSWKHLWTSTAPADGMCPSEAEEYARRAGAAAAAKLVPPRLMCICYLFSCAETVCIAVHLIFSCSIPKSSKVKAVGFWRRTITSRSQLDHREDYQRS